MTDLAYADLGARADTTAGSSRYRGFACPHEPFNETLLENVQVDYCRRLVNTLLRRFGETLEHHGDIVSFIRDWHDSEVTFAAVWDPSFGVVRELLAKTEPSLSDVLPAFAALALRLCEVGSEGGFALCFPEPCMLRFGHFVLPAASGISVEAGRGQASITLRTGRAYRTLSFARQGSAWVGDGVEPLPQLHTPAGTVTLLPPWLAEVHSFVDIALANRQMLPAVQRKLEALYALVEQRTPRYLPWFARSVRFIVPFDGPPGEAQGGSFRFRPATVTLSHEAAELQLADYLAHEATHEYFYMLQPAKRIDDGSDDTLYLNPIINAKRRVDYMALAFHAFANDVLFCRDYLASGPDPANYCTYRDTTLTEALAPFCELLSRTQALTEVGRGLVDPLLERL